MGGECSVLLSRPGEGLDFGHPSSEPSGPTAGVAVGSADEPDVSGCGLCCEHGDSSAVPNGTLNGAAGLLMLDAPLLGLSRDETPRTPRGPAPPWAVTASRIVDRTATGLTPPRSPKPTRATPPGLPEDDAREAMTMLSLHASFDAAFVRELFAAARSGCVSSLSDLLQKLRARALSLVVGTQKTPASPEQSDKAAELTTSFLNKAREPLAAPTLAPVVVETLLGVAAAGGHVDAVQMLLQHRADPFICDGRESTALHHAAESGSLVVVLLILDRMQAHSRSLVASDLLNADNDTPEMLAALAGSADISRALETFNDLQRDAEVRQLGYLMLTTGDTPRSSRGEAGGSDVFALLDLAADPRSGLGRHVGLNLRRAIAGVEGGLVPNFHSKISESEAGLQQLMTTVCVGVQTAEDYLLKHDWHLDEQQQPYLQAFLHTAELRSAWLALRQDVASSDTSEGLADFWQTNLRATAMIATMSNARGDTFQLLLALLWLYTREAWLRHIIEALAVVIHSSITMPSSPSNSGALAADGATGASPLGNETTRCAGATVAVPEVLAPLVDSLAPCMQLVQSALAWFDSAGIRHHVPTYKPLSISMHELKQLEKHFNQRRDISEVKKDDCESGSLVSGLATGTWITLGAGSFFATMSSRPDALRRVIKTKCNALLVIRPDEHCPFYPKQMALRGIAVEDVLYPLGGLYRVTRITRTVSSDLDPSDYSQSKNSRWPVHIIELSAGDRFVEALELLEKRGELGAEELETLLHRWVDSSSDAERPRCLYSAAELLARCAGNGESATPGATPASNCGAGSGGTSGQVAATTARGRRREQAAGMFSESARLSEENKEPQRAAQALLAAAKCGNLGSGRSSDFVRLAADGRRAVGLLERTLGANHPETCAAREAWRDLGVPLKTPAPVTDPA